jgi:hypothetical protein
MKNIVPADWKPIFHENSMNVSYVKFYEAGEEGAASSMLKTTKGTTAAPP